ncbi:MAG: hypothetical protein HY401_07805 [Elusimicrobia bacterium]|nr:hypothetical protein [Elusimicrobiota bacterium]
MLLRNWAAVALVGLVLCRQSCPAESGPASWNASQTQHFDLFHEAKKLPTNAVLGMEKIHSRLRLQMDILAPWIKKTKIRLYVYENQQAYVRGEFHPPSWSKGVSFYSSKTVVLYQTASMDDFFETAAHELTHLLAVSFFQEKNREPPLWLEEGLATLMEEMACPDSQRRHWAAGAISKTSWRPEPLAEFFIRPPPEKESSRQDANSWYLQSYSLTKYLFVAFGKLRFKVFCDNLRAGASLEKSLWKTYRMRSIEDLEEKWLGWLKNQRRAVR